MTDESVTEAPPPETVVEAPPPNPPTALERVQGIRQRLLPQHLDLREQIHALRNAMLDLVNLHLEHANVEENGRRPGVDGGRDESAPKGNEDPKPASG